MIKTSMQSESFDVREVYTRDTAVIQSNHFSKLRASHQDAARQLNRSQAIALKN